MTPPDDGRPVSERVVAAVSRERDADPTDLDPLYDAVDPEAIDDLFPVAADATGDSVREFTFTYEGYVVRIARDGTITLSDAESGSVADDSAGVTATVTTGCPDATD